MDINSTITLLLRAFITLSLLFSFTQNSYSSTTFYSASDGRILDNDANGIYESITLSPTSLSIRNLSSLREVSVSNYDITTANNFIAQAASLHIYISDIANSTNNVDIYAFNDDSNVELEDATQNAVYLGSYNPTALSLGSHTIQLDAEALTPLLQANYLTLRFSSDYYAANTQLQSQYLGTGPILDVDLVPSQADLQPPTAKAGNDRIVPPYYTVSLNGQSSSDNVAIDTYYWQQVSGPNVALQSADTPWAEFLSPELAPGENATLVFELTVTDTSGLTDTDQIEVTVVQMENPGYFYCNNEALITDNDGSGDFDTFELFPMNLSVKTFSFVKEVSTTDCLFYGIEEMTVVKGIMQINIMDYTSNSSEVNIYAFADNGVVELEDATKPGVLIGSYTPSSLSIGQHSISLDIEQLNTALESGNSLTLRYESNGNGTNTQLNITHLILDTAEPEPPMIPPVANAGGNQSYPQNAPVELDGTASSDDESIVSYQWIQTSGTVVQLVGANSANPSFTTPILAADITETLTFQLTVTDNSGLTNSDSVDVVIEANAAPTADAGVNQSYPQNAPVELDGTASSDDESIVSYQWIQTSGTVVQLGGGNSANPSFTTPILAADITETLTFQLTVTDNNGLTNSDSVDVVIEANAAPTADAGSNLTVIQQSLVTLDGSASLDDNTIVSFAWRQTAGAAVSLSDSQSPSPNFYAPRLRKEKSTTLSFELTIIDELGLMSVDTVDVLVTKR